MFFIKKNVPITIEDYQCHIDTVDHIPKVATNIRFGMHDTPKMQGAIDSLLQKNQIVPDEESVCLAKPVLYPKPHQENVTEKEADMIKWRFCVSYIPLNSVTKVIPYPIPRYNDSIQMRIGKAVFKILMDDFSGYHQIKMATTSSYKTAFAGPGGRKYRYVVVLFGLVNGSVIFVVMIHDLKGYWDDLAREWGVGLDNSTNTIISIDDTFISAMMKIIFLSISKLFWRYPNATISHGN